MSIAQVWEVPPDGLVSILVAEPAGLSIGKVTLKGEEEVLGVLAEPFLTEVRVPTHTLLQSYSHTIIHLSIHTSIYLFIPTIKHSYIYTFIHS